MDRLSSAERSKVMAAVRGSRTRLEDEFCLMLRQAGFRSFRRNVKTVPGRPDVVFQTARVAVFLDSCFWHGCRRHLRRPATNVEYWREKIRRNRARDRAVTTLLTAAGWKVARFWEHQLRQPPGRAKALHKLRRLLAEEV